MDPIYSRPAKSAKKFDNGFCVQFDDSSKRTVQVKPYNVPTDFDARHGTYVPGVLFSLGSPRSAADTIADKYYDNTIAGRVLAKAYESVKGKTYESVSTGADFAEYKSSLGMMTRTCATLLRAGRAIKKFDFLAAAQILKMHLVPPGASRRKSFANNWLEFWFGWKPLLSDIYDAMEVLNQPIKKMYARGGGVDGIVTQDSVNLGSTTDTYTVSMRYEARQGLTVKTIDYETFSLEQWGLANPLSVLWEIVPFSFVVDWFYRVGDVVASLTDFLGMTLVDTFYSLKTMTHEVGVVKINPGWDDGGAPSRLYHGFGVLYSRRAGLSAPTFGSKGLKLPSAARVATSVALVTQMLTKK